MNTHHAHNNLFTEHVKDNLDKLQQITSHQILFTIHTDMILYKRRSQSTPDNNLDFSDRKMDAIHRLITQLHTHTLLSAV